MQNGQDPRGCLFQYSSWPELLRLPSPPHPRSPVPGPQPQARVRDRSLEGGAVSSPAASLHAPPPARRPRPQASPSAARLAFDAPRPANGRAGRRRLRRRARGSARSGVSPAAATAAGSCLGDLSGSAQLRGCSRRRRARRGEPQGPRAGRMA